MPDLQADERSRGQETSRIVREQADRLFAQHVTKGAIAAAEAGPWPAVLWQAVEAAGLPLALVPEAKDGIGLSARDAMAIVRRAAYHALPLPLGETVVANALWAAAGGDPAEGPVTIAPTIVAAPTLQTNGGTPQLSGRLNHVPWGADAHILLLAIDFTGAEYLVRLPPGTGTAAPRRNLAGEPRVTLTLDAISVAQDAVRPAKGIGTGGLGAFGALVRAQQMVGAMERAMDYALQHATDRVQFGKPIGKFQAIQHMLAEAAGHYAAASAAADLAAESFGTGDFGFAVATAKARAGEAAGKVAEICHQVHGAMGFTQEHPLHFSTRRLWSWRDEFGAEPYWQEQIGRLVCAGGGEALWPMLTQLGRETP